MVEGGQAEGLESTAGQHRYVMGGRETEKLCSTNCFGCPRSGLAVLSGLWLFVQLCFIPVQSLGVLSLTVSRMMARDVTRFMCVVGVHSVRLG